MCRNVRISKYGDTLLSPPDNSDDETAKATLKGKFRRALRHISDQDTLIKQKEDEAVAMECKLAELKDIRAKLKKVQMREQELER